MRNAHNVHQERRTSYKQKTSLSPAELADLKSKSKCHACGKLGHWATDKVCEEYNKSNSSVTPNQFVFDLTHPFLTKAMQTLRKLSRLTCFSG